MPLVCNGLGLQTRGKVLVLLLHIVGIFRFIARCFFREYKSKGFHDFFIVDINLCEFYKVMQGI
jgi:hypothetical protein